MGLVENVLFFIFFAQGFWLNKACILIGFHFIRIIHRFVHTLYIPLCNKHNCYKWMTEWGSHEDVLSG